MDSPGQYVRICYLDFSKAFDRINLNILVQKLIAIGARPSLIKWISNFLSERTQRVKIGDSFSDWTHTHAGVPQGTKLGYILFLVIVNNLASSSPLNLDHWIFVDDLTTSETVSRLEHPKMQPNIINLENWSDSNYMKLSPKKCKEMCVCLLKNKPDLQPITIYGNQIERVSSHKLLGVVIQDDLKWSSHIDMITKKGSKRLHIIRVLRCSLMPANDLLKVYPSLIRPVLEYCWPVWHPNLPIYLSDRIERIQKRAFRIMYPTLSYEDALQTTCCTRLSIRRHHLCLKTFETISSNNSKLAHLLPKKRRECHGRCLRKSNNFSLFSCRTNRFKHSFFPFYTNVFNS